jgi:hypothetical protein
MHYFFSKKMLILSTLVIGLLAGCVSMKRFKNEETKRVEAETRYNEVEAELAKKQNTLVNLQKEIAELKKDYKITVINGYGREITNVSLYEQFGVRVSGFAPNATYAFALKTRSRRIIRDEILIETNHLGTGGVFVAWNGLDDYDQLPEYLKEEMISGITIEVRQTRGTARNIDAFLPSQFVYTSDGSGQKKSSFIQQRDADNIYLTLKGLSRDTTYTIYVTRRTEWYKGKPIFDVTNRQQGLPITIRQDSTRVLLWERNGIYGWGKNNLAGGFQVILAKGDGNIAKFDSATCQVYEPWGSLFVIQRFSRKEDRAQNLTRHGEKYRPNDLIFVGVDPKNGKGEQPSELVHAFIYFVRDRIWTDGMEIGDGTNGTNGIQIIDKKVVLEDYITIRPGCTNVNEHRFPVPLITGDFDIIIDLDGDRKYTKGTDIIDGLYGPGFTVVPTPETIIATIWDKMDTLNAQFNDILKIELPEQMRSNSSWRGHSRALEFAVVPSARLSYFPPKDYRYEPLDSVLNVVASEIVEYLNEYEVEYLIRCVGPDTGYSIEMTYDLHSDDERKIEYQPLQHPWFTGSAFKISKRGDTIESMHVLALLRGFYLYRGLLERGTLSDCVGIGTSEKYKSTIGIEFKVAYRPPERQSM